MLRLAGTQMIILTQYHVVMKNGIYRVVSDKPSVCPSCQGALKVRDSKRRQVILADGQTHIFLLRRLKCKKCGALHLELPDLFVPHKHYSREVINMALSGKVPSCPAENSTIYRWEKERSRMS